MRKVVGVTAVVVVVLLVLGLGAGGWYYTDELLDLDRGARAR